MIDFPSSPVNGQQFLASNGTTYQFVSPPDVWTVLTGRVESASIDARDYGLAETGDVNQPKRNTAAINKAILESNRQRRRAIIYGGPYDIADEIKTRPGSNIVFEPETILRPVAWSLDGTMMGNLLTTSNDAASIQDLITIEGLNMDFANYPDSPRFVAAGGGGGINNVLGTNGTLILNASDNGTTNGTSILQRIQAATFTGTASGTTMTVTAVTGFISLNSTLFVTGGGAAIPSLTVFTEQLTGAIGGAGTYLTNKITTVSSTPCFISQPVFLKLDQGTGSDVKFYSIIGFSGGFGGTVTINGPWIGAAPSTDTVYQWGYNDNALSFGGGASNVRVTRMVVTNIPGDQLFGAGGKGIDIEQGDTNIQVHDLSVVGRPDRPCVAGIFVQGISGSYVNGALRRASRIHITKVHAENCSAAVNVGGSDPFTSATAAVASIAGTTLTVSGTITGTWEPDLTLAQTLGTSGNSVVGTKIVAQILPLTGGEVLGGAGRYTVDVSQTWTIASTTPPTILNAYQIEGDPNELSCIVDGVFAHNCGHFPYRFASDPQKSGIIIMPRVQNSLVTNVVAYNDPGYPQASLYPTDYTGRISAGLSGPIGAVIWGWGRNTTVDNVLYIGDADALVQLNRCRAAGEDGRPNGRIISTYDLKISGLRHFNGTLKNVVKMDPLFPADNKNVKVNISAELSESTNFTDVLFAGAAGYTNTKLEIYDRKTDTRIIGTADQIVTAGNLLTSFKAGHVSDFRFGNVSVDGYLHVKAGTEVPVSTTPGDITGTRLSLGNGALTGVVARLSGPMGSGAAGNALYIDTSIQPSMTNVGNMVAPIVSTAPGNYAVTTATGVRASTGVLGNGAGQVGVGSVLTTLAALYADSSNTKGTVNYGGFFNLPTTIDSNAGAASTMQSFSVASNVVSVTATGAHGLTSTQTVTVIPNDITAGSFVVGGSYFIATLGTTNFTLIGAASNTVNLQFTATGVGTGTGTATPAIGGSGCVATVTGANTFTYPRATPNTTGHTVGGTITPAKNWNIGIIGNGPSYSGGPWRFGAINTMPTASVDASGSAAIAPVRIRHGVAPTTPNDGDVWTTTAGMFVRVNGVTKTVTLT